MKKLFMVFAVVLFSIAGTQAQENKDVQQETTVKKVIQKDTNVKTQVTKKTNTKKEVVEVEGTLKQDQASTVIKKKNEDTKVVSDDVTLDVANQQKMMALKQQHEADMARKIAEQNAQAAAEAEMERQAKIRQQQADLEARRAALMNRPDGMVKLKKN
ncbi:MAG: hypothetical protein JJE55_02155 [Flavobacteriaceae bacterium]|nr:hypothetical protein [Flavobacteriaceae bacterium]